MLFYQVYKTSYITEYLRVTWNFSLITTFHISWKPKVPGSSPTATYV